MKYEVGRAGSFIEKKKILASRWRFKLEINVYY